MAEKETEAQTRVYVRVWNDSENEFLEDLSGALNKPKSVIFQNITAKLAFLYRKYKKAGRNPLDFIEELTLTEET